MCGRTNTLGSDACVFSYLAQRLVKLLQDALFIKHLALVSVLVVVMDFLSEVGWQLVERHVLLHLFVLEGGEKQKHRLKKENSS